MAMGSFAVNSQGTHIEISINNLLGYSYDIAVILAQPSAIPANGSLTFTASPNNLTIMNLEFDDVDICVEEVVCTYKGQIDDCPYSNSIETNCYGEVYYGVDIAPEDGPHRCHTFSYYSFSNPNYCIDLYYDFQID